MKDRKIRIKSKDETKVMTEDIRRRLDLIDKDLNMKLETLDYIFTGSKDYPEEFHQLYVQPLYGIRPLSRRFLLPLGRRRSPSQLTFPAIRPSSFLPDCPPPERKAPLWSNPGGAFCLLGPFFRLSDCPVRPVLPPSARPCTAAATSYCACRHSPRPCVLIALKWLQYSQSKWWRRTPCSLFWGSLCAPAIVLEEPGRRAIVCMLVPKRVVADHRL